MNLLAFVDFMLLKSEGMAKLMSYLKQPFFYFPLSDLSSGGALNETFTDQNSFFKAFATAILDKIGYKNITTTVPNIPLNIAPNTIAMTAANAADSAVDSAKASKAALAAAKKAESAAFNAEASAAASEAALAALNELKEMETTDNSE